MSVLNNDQYNGHIFSRRTPYDCRRQASLAVFADEPRLGLDAMMD
jgi:hypothetical protein